MGPWPLACAALALGPLLTGCATAYSRGEEAFRAGRYQQAAREFETAATRDGRRLDALTGLGISRYKLGDLTGAEDVLRRVLAQEAGRGEARLYVALVAIGRREDARAIEALEALRPGIHHPRIAATVDRALAALREQPTEPVRRLIAASLDDAAGWARDVRDASRRIPAHALEPSWTLYRDHRLRRFP
jgi:tetratricopeptide (TPR) repeat protein